MSTIAKRGNTYRITVSCGYDMNNKQIRKSMTWTPLPGMTPKQIEKELQKQAVLFEEKCASGQYMDGNIKFADFAERWFKDYAEKQLKVRTIARYREFMQRINPAIGHIRLDRLQPVHLIQFYDNLAEKGIRNDIKYKPVADIGQMLKDMNIKKVDFKKMAEISDSTLLAVCKGSNVKEKSAYNIAKALGVSVEQIFKADEKSQKGLSDITILHYHRLISSILTCAVQWQVIIANPCNRVKPPKVERRTARYLDDIQTAEMFKYLQNEPYQYKTMITVLVYTGMRRGELFGLKWSDIDFKNKLISINRSRLYLPKVGTFEDSTKTYSSQRVMKVSDIVLQSLKLYKAQQDIEKNKVGDKWQGTEYVFTSWDGKPFHPDSLTGWFGNFIKRYNLPDVCIHSLRHTNATLLIANGVNLTTVASRLGHSNTSTTANIYAHAIKTADEMAADTLQDILSKASNMA